jgi:hypothetical protein
MALSPEEIAAQLRAKSQPKVLAESKAESEAAPKSPAPKPPRESARPREKASVDVVAEAPEAELYTLSALAQFPATCFPIFHERGGRSDFFWVPAHKTLFGLLSDYFTVHRHVDGVAFMQHAIDAGHLPQLGGPGLVASLWTRNSAPESFAYHLDILRDKYVAREIARISRELPNKVSRVGDEELWTVIGEHERAISDLRALATDKLQGVENFAYSDLVGFDATKDESVLIGAHRWLGRGYTCLWAGGPGYGKSALLMQAALYWATGTPLFGIKPVRPLKSLIIQAENDLGDTGEQFQGVIAGIKATGDVSLNGEVERMIIVNRLIGCVGDQFLARLKSLLKLHKPDLVWIDPLFAFAGCDLIDTEAVSRFLREGLIPIAVEHQVCAHVVHHISKPARDNDAKKQWSSQEYQFLGFGSSEIQNAFRAVNILLPVSGHEGVFKLVLSKRGSRAGAKDVDGESTNTLYLSHGKQGNIIWSQVEEPDEPEKQKRNVDSQFQSKFTVSTVLDEMSVTEGVTAGDLQKHMKNETGMSEKTFYRLWSQIKESGKIKIGDDRKWFLKT